MLRAILIVASVGWILPFAASLYLIVDYVENPFAVVNGKTMPVIIRQYLNVSVVWMGFVAVSWAVFLSKLYVAKNNKNTEK